MNYIGIDIHKKYCVLSALNEAGERTREARIATNDRAGFEEYLRALGGPCKAVIEACWGWGKVHDLLEATGLVEEVVLAHPYKTRIIAEAQIKTDKVDARALAFLLRLNAVPRAHVPRVATRRRKEVLRQRLFWVRERTKLRNRVHALLDRQNTELALPVCSDLFGVKGSRALEALASTLAEPDSAKCQTDSRKKASIPFATRWRSEPLKAPSIRDSRFKTPPHHSPANSHCEERVTDRYSKQG